MPIDVQGLDHVALRVRDLEKSVRWYKSTLGLERRYEGEWGDYPTMLCAGETCLALFEAADWPSGEAGTGFRHVAFRLSRRAFEEAQATLRRKSVAVHFSDHRLSHSLYLRDPDGYQIELTTYELA